MYLGFFSLTTGLARYAPCGTTNLHLDISDAVNVMVYVGKPHSVDGNETCDSYEKGEWQYTADHSLRCCIT